MIDLETTSPLVARVQAFEQLQRVENYLYQTTYASDGMGSMRWAHWFDNVASAIELLAASEASLRFDIVKRLGGAIQ